MVAGTDGKPDHRPRTNTPCGTATKHAGDHVCTTPTLRDHQIKAAFLAALSELSPTLEAPGLREDLAAVFDTKQLEAKRAELAERQAELEGS